MSHIDINKKKNIEVCAGLTKFRVARQKLPGDIIKTENFVSLFIALFTAEPSDRS